MADGFNYNTTVKTGSQSSSTSYPEWYNQYLANLIEVGGGLAQEEYIPYAGARIADFTPDQLQAANMQREAALDPTWQQYVPIAGDAIQHGSNLLGEAGFGALNAMSGQTPFSQQGYDAMYQGVYEPAVTKMQNEINRIGQKDFKDTTLAELNRNFTGAGQFGSSRDQILSSDAAARAQAEIEGKQAAAEMTGRTSAAKDYLDWSKQGVNAAQATGQLGGQNMAAGQNWFNFGAQQQGAQAADTASLAALGAQQQQMNQNNLNLAYQDFQQQVQYPWDQMSKWSALTRGQQFGPSTTSGGSDSMSSLQYGYPGSVSAPSSNPWTSALQGGLGAASGIWNMFK